MEKDYFKIERKELLYQLLNGDDKMLIGNQKETKFLISYFGMIFSIKQWWKIKE